MSKYSVTLREIIYHYSQGMLPIPIAKEQKTEYVLPSGRTIYFAPITMEQDISVHDRMEMCKNILLPSDINFYDEQMRNEYYTIFCAENLMREIEYETTEYFLMRWKTNIIKCISKYNRIWEMLLDDYNFLSDYTRNADITDDDDVTHGKVTDGSGKNTLTHGLKVETDNSGKATSKTVFEDTPENELMNTSYATNITKVENESKSGSVTQNSGDDVSEVTNQTKESGTTKRDYHRILKEYGRNKSIASIMDEIWQSRTNVIENMVDETSRNIFMKVY